MPILTNEELAIISYTNTYMHIYKKIVSFILGHKDFKYEHKIEYINLCCDKMQKFVSIINKHKGKHNNKECIYLFINLFEKTEMITVSIFFDVLEDFIKRLSKDQTKDLKKKITNEKNIINKIHECSMNNYINENGLNLLVDYILL